jgi:hypothetical protein
VTASSDQKRIESFLGRHGVLGGSLHHESGTKCLDATEPTVLANFIAYWKSPGRGRGRQIFLRGESEFHLTLVPKLFRSPGIQSKTWAAYRAFIKGLPARVRGTRFRRSNFGAVLQHYGFHTPWLDVVDDVNAAIWFALHERSQDSAIYRYHPSKRSHGWVVLVAAGRGVRVQNLRENHSSRNSRCNAQQGYSLAMQYDNEDHEHRQQDFGARVIGRVRIPNSPQWHLRGFRASQGYFFPVSDYDDTYRQLLTPAVETLVERIEREHDLQRGALGRVARY